MQSRWPNPLALLGAVPALVLGLALTRLLYDLLFPLPWLGQPLPVASVALLFAVAGALVWQSLFRRRHNWLAATLPFLPFYLNLLTLLDPAPDLARARFLFAAALWLSCAAAIADARRPWPFLVALLIGAAALYLPTMPHTVGRADTFEFQVVAPRLGIVHPTGYPLYLLLGKLFTLIIPVGSPAWRLNLASAVYGLAALVFVYLLGRALHGRDAPALAGAAALALTPTFWSQAIEAEVYTLHLLFVAAILFLLVRWLRQGPPSGARGWLLLPFLLGLGLTNHLTTVFLLPPALLTLFYLRRAWPRRLSFWAGMLLAFLLPLLLYAYLPLRWAAVNGEPMGWSRFWDWVVGGRFQGALQWLAWWRDPARYAVVGRLFLAEWGWFGLAWAAAGWLLLLRRQPRAVTVLLLAWLGYTFYALNYYVPDLSVFLLPAQLVIAIGWGAVALWLGRRPAVVPAIALAALIAPILLAAAQWSALDRSGDDGLTTWGRAVLALPLETGAAILADSEKIAPLYYLQQAEGVRPDLDILVLPDEATYRAELDARLAQGQAVYLARFLPGLEGVYHLGSLGPLLAVREKGVREMPASTTPTALSFPQNIHLSGYQLQPQSPYDPAHAALTLYWRADAPVNENQYVYIRWTNGSITTAPLPPTGRHPANNDYPTAAWEPGEIVADFHDLPRPILPQDAPFQLQVALAPPFTHPDALSWQVVTTVMMPATDPQQLTTQPRRALIGPVALTGLDAPAQIRPQTPLPLTLTGFAPDPASLARLEWSLSAAPEFSPRAFAPPPAFAPRPFAWSATLDTDLPPGTYQIVARAPDSGARCGWLRPSRAGCVVGEVTISGAPLPPGATNFGDKIALLQVAVSSMTLTPGGQLGVDLTWQALAPMSENYTVFVQVLDAEDRIVGQVDAWPLQGTFPTGQWQPGQTVADPYVVSLAPDLRPGPYRLQVGFYLLATLQRLPVLDAGGVPVDDHYLLSGLEVRGGE